MEENMAVSHPENSDCTAHRNTERGRAHDVANTESGSVTTCGQIRFEKFWAHLRNEFQGLT